MANSTGLPNSRLNNSDYTELPIDMRFNDGHIVSIVIYSVLMIISAIGNTTILVLITRRKRLSKSRIHTMLMHLAIADLLVSMISKHRTIFFFIAIAVNLSNFY